MRVCNIPFGCNIVYFWPKFRIGDEYICMAEHLSCVCVCLIICMMDMLARCTQYLFRRHHKHSAFQLCDAWEHESYLFLRGS